MRVYERATRAVADEDRMNMFDFYITKSATNFGLTSTRPIYERAIASLPDKEAKTMCLKFAEMERRLGEIDRARAIYGHGSQFADPRVDKGFWEVWEKFEVAHGNEDTFKEMLRIKRSVAAQFNTDVQFIASQAVKRGLATAGVAEADGDDGQGDERDKDAMAALERQARAPVGFVAASTGPEGGNRGAKEAAAAEGLANGNGETKQVAANPDAIDVDIDDDE
jgi:pre-mRNA-splicing factor SYF1